MKIAVLEDNPDLQVLVKFTLEADGHEVICFDDPIPMMNPFALSGVDVFLVDLMTGPVSGVTFLRWAVHHFPRVRRIVMTALSKDQITGALELADGFILKPFGADQLEGILHG